MLNRFIGLIGFSFSLILIEGYNASLPAQVATLKPTFHLKILNGMYVPYQNNMAVPDFNKQPRDMINLAGVWKKQRFMADHDLTLTERDSLHYLALLSEAGDRYKPGYNDGHSEITGSVPHAQ